MQALVEHDIESERDALGDVEPMKVVNLRRMFVSRRSNLVSVRHVTRAAELYLFIICMQKVEESETEVK